MFERFPPCLDGNLRDRGGIARGSGVSDFVSPTRRPLRASEANDLLFTAIDEAISRKPKGHDFLIERTETHASTRRHMSVTGG